MEAGHLIFKIQFQTWQVWLHTFLLHSIVKIQCLLLLAHISQIPILGQSNWPHRKMASCWTLCEHPPFSHIWHTYQSSYFPQRHQPCNQFPWAAPELACPPLSSCKLAHTLSTMTILNLSSLIPFSCIRLKSSIAPSLSIPYKPSVPWKAVKLYNPWCYCSQLCCHPWRVSPVPEP